MKNSSPNPRSPAPARWSRRYGPGLVVALTLAAAVLILLGAVADGFGWKPAGPRWLDDLAQLLYGLGRVFTFGATPKDELRNPFLQLGAICVVLLAGTVAYSVLARFWDHLRLGWLHLNRGRHVVVCGLGRIGTQLAEDFCLGRQCEPRRVVAIERDEHNRAIVLLRDLGAVVLIGDAADPELLARAHASSAERVFAVTGSDAVNTEIAAELILPSPPLDGRRRQPVCHVHLTDPDQAELLRLAPAVVRLKRHTQVEAFNLYQVTARRLLLAILTARSPQEQETAHYIVLGFGIMGQTFAREVALQGHLGNRKRIRLTLGDADIEAKREAFLDRHPAFCPAPGTLDLTGACAGLDGWDTHDPAVRPLAEAQVTGNEYGPGIEYVCNAEFLTLPAELDSEKLARQLRRRVAQPATAVSIVVCFEDDALNFEIALHLRKWLQGHGREDVFVWLSSFPALSRLTEGADEHPVRLIPFGNAREVCAAAAILHPHLEDLALAMHEEYRASRLRENPAANDPAVRPWAELDEGFRRSNRLRAWHVDIKLSVLGMRRAPKRDVIESQRATAFSKPETELLAEIEHNRWLADRLMDGWRYAPKTDKVKKLHADLVPYSLLPEGTKNYDRTSAAEILEVLDRYGQQAARKQD